MAEASKKSRFHRLFRWASASSRDSDSSAPVVESHRETLDRLMTARASRSVPELFNGVTDDFWFWAFTEGYRTDARLREVLPAYPPSDVQQRYTGAADDDTMREGMGFYGLVKSLVNQHLDRPLTSVLEFGCGWGRMIRLFLRDVQPHNLWGIDCMPDAIDLCSRMNRHARFELVEPLPPTSLPDNQFDLIYAYSVFSHLSEAAHLQWLSEFRRILKPGGLVIATTRPREFILQCAQAREQGQQEAWALGTVFSFKNTEEALARYDRGEFLYEPIGGGDVLDKSFYGETCIPQQYVQNNWTRLFEFVGYVDDRRLSLQNVIVVRKT